MQSQSKDGRAPVPHPHSLVESELPPPPLLPLVSGLPGARRSATTSAEQMPLTCRGRVDSRLPHIIICVCVQGGSAWQKRMQAAYVFTC